MDNWTILAIEKTDDREAIKQAYMSQLPQFNPEEDAEGFLRLRTAYEEILRSLDETAPEEDTPFTLWIKQVEEVYNDFHKRNDPSAWKTLLENEVCQRLDMVDTAEGQLLTFILDNHILPMHIWNALSLHFDWEGRESILLQNFPASFIEYIIRKSKEPEHPKHDLFVAKKPVEASIYDQWISLFAEIDAMLNTGKHADPTLEARQDKLEALPISHPYYAVLETRLAMCRGHYETAFEIIEDVHNQHPDDLHIWFAYAAVLPHVGKEEEALAHFEKIHAANPGLTDAKKGILNSQLKQKDFEAANLTAKEILKVSPYDIYALSAINHIASELVQVYEEKYNAIPDDEEIALKLAGFYIRNQQVDKCKGLMSTIENPKDSIRYREISAICAALEEDYRLAVTLYIGLIDEAPKLEYYDYIASALNRLNRYEQSLSFVEKALSVPEYESDKLGLSVLYIYKCQALLALGKNDAALAAVDQGLELCKSNAHLWMQKANLSYNTGQYTTALDCSEKAISIYPYMPDPYVLQMEIYHKEGMFDQVLEVAARAESIEYNSPRIKCHKAEALRVMGEYDQALEIMDALVEADFQEGYSDAIFTEMAQLKEATGNYVAANDYINRAIALSTEDNLERRAILANILRKQGNYSAALTLYDQLLAKSQFYLPSLIGKGNVFADMGDILMAIMSIETAINVAEHYEPAYDRIVDILMDAGKDEEALTWTERRLAKFESLPNRIYAAIAHVRLKQNNQAEDIYKKTIELYPESSAGHRYYGLFLQSNKRFKEASSQFTKSLEIDPLQLDLYESMAYCYQEEKDYDQALKILDLADKAFAQICEDSQPLSNGDESPSVPNTSSAHKAPDADNTPAPLPYNFGALAMRRGIIYEDMQRYDEALTQMQLAAANPDKLDDEWQMSWIYVRIGLIYAKNFNNPAKAMEYFKQSIAEDADYIEAYDYMGDIYLYAHNNYAKAIECYDKKIEKEPDDPHSYVTRAIAYKRSRRFIRATRDYKKALELYHKKNQEDPSPCWQVYIANCKLALKEVNEAKQAYESGLDTPSQPGAWCSKPICDVCLYGLAQIAEQEKDYDQALAYYNRAIEISNSVKHNAALNDLKTKLQK